jgi:glycosyltransferase involved in cell wall biosynthesis
MASRGYISALWQSGLQVNLHPIYRPFHIHGRSALTIDVCDFDGPADVCIIHLNPDAWPGLLEDRHYRQIMKGAKKRVGLWVWEMETIPKQWSTAFREVDAVWAPSNYCRAAFELASATPVRVLPHVVMAPAPNLRPSQMREKLGLPSNRQLILYIFDGASYLIRKNPFALVRAFGASGLHRQGWSLVLKTKNLMDRPDEGRELVSLIEGFREVYLINQNLSQYENFALMESCSVYASPHSAEGFGLTVAEAMALGKIVVATDYSGTRDFLDSTCGFPVKWRIQQLDRNHGHYFRGGVWAEIDEVDLARALNDAARAAADPDQVIGHAAAARIRTQLSPISIGACIRELIQDLVQ